MEGVTNTWEGGAARKQWVGAPRFSLQSRLKLCPRGVLEQRLPIRKVSCRSARPRLWLGTSWHDCAPCMEVEAGSTAPGAQVIGWSRTAHCAARSEQSSQSCHSDGISISSLCVSLTLWAPYILLIQAICSPCTTIPDTRITLVVQIKTLQDHTVN